MIIKIFSRIILNKLVIIFIGAFLPLLVILYVFIWQKKDQLEQVSVFATDQELKEPIAEPSQQTHETVAVESIPPKLTTLNQREPQTTESIIEPKFDLVRIDAEGDALIAGQSISNTITTIVANEKDIAKVNVGKDGHFVAFLNFPANDVPIVLRLKYMQPNGIEVVSNDSFLILSNLQKNSISPVIISANANGVDIVQAMDIEQSPRPNIVTSLTLDTIDYAAEGDIVFSGRGNAEQSVKVYVDNQPQKISRIENGKWSLSLPNVDEGIYKIRVEALDPQGRVTSWVESLFKREKIDENQPGSKVFIQPGYTLWQLAKQKYGQGIRYVQIFEANKNNIVNPDLIYPGQIFTLPDL